MDAADRGVCVHSGARRGPPNLPLSAKTRSPAFVADQSRAVATLSIARSATTARRRALEGCSKNKHAFAFLT